MSVAIRSFDAVEHPLPPTFGTCFVIHDFLAPHECADLIAQAVERGFASAAANYPPSYRDNERQVVDDPALAKHLLLRLRGRIPETITDADGSTWRLAALNERLRLCRYREGQQFRIHQDGVHHRGADERSRLTFMIYLDGPESFDGGDTVFYADGPRAEPAVIARVRPRRGSVIVFDHALWHAGEPLTRGRKHILRSDLVYRRVGPRVETPRAYAGHDGYVWTLQHLADGRVASGGRDGAIRVWSPGGMRHTRLDGHAQSVLGLAQTASGRLVSVSRDRSLRWWNLDSQRCESAVIAHDAAALCVVRASRGRLATGGADGTIALWSDDGDELARLRGHAGWVWALAIVDDNTLASASEDGSVKLWDLREARCRMTVAGDRPLRAIAAKHRADGSIELAAGDDRGRVRACSIAGAAIEPVAAFAAHDAAVRRLRYFDDGSLTSCGEDYRVRVWRDARCIYETAHANFATDAARIGGGRMLSCGYDGVLKESHILQ
ncbi:2OG-Fe(II) oxygenase [Tahibacter soli]|uniref:2OG-Fe(II) oxygenase n=1 Tax=Tahibacter soli TaxID=2983605 RepID=A0A9X3YKM2_9GAMM|nr:2OG-Fe(II) oxygenase [Tahibacter soli]MDC8012518.1 2OG-Fe(II) oxygenase [Tahibacter soli]